MYQVQLGLLLLFSRSVWTFVHAVQSSIVSDSLWPHRLQHFRLPCPSPSPRACSNSCLLSQWCHPTISSSVIPFSSCLQSFPVSGSFLMSQLFTSDSQSIGASVSASALPMNIQDWFPLWLTGLVSLQSKGLSKVFFNTSKLILWGQHHPNKKTRQRCHKKRKLQANITDEHRCKNP